MQTKTSLTFLSATLMGLFLTACGGGSGSSALDSALNGSSSSTAGTVDWRLGNGSGTTFNSGKISQALDGNSSVLFAGNTTSLGVSIVNESGTPITDTIPVQFSSPCITAGTSKIVDGAKVNSTTGTITAQYQPVTCLGDDKVTASVTYKGKTLTANTTVTTSNIRLGQGTGLDFIPTKLDLGTNADSLFTDQSTSLTLNIVDDFGNLVTTPMPITFSSTCLTANTSSITGGKTVNSIGGKVKADYKAGTCFGDDTITASTTYAGNVISASGTILKVNNKRIGSGSGTNFTPEVITASTGTTTLYEGDTTDLSVNIVNNQSNLISQATTVAFDSQCISQGLSSIAGGNTVVSINGVAKVKYKVGKCLIDDVITATIANGNTTATATTTIPVDTRQLGSGFGTAFINNALEVGIGSGSLSPGGSTTVTAYIVNSKGDLVSDPMDVTFSSPCLSAGNAAITGGNIVKSVNGKAVATYTSQGCSGVNGLDAIKASTTFRNLVLTAAADIAVVTDKAQTISFVSASPALINIKGTGGLETSVLTFKVTGQGGSPLKGVCVTFAPSTTVGGLGLVKSDCNPDGPGVYESTTDANGLATTTVQAGTVATAVRVTASVDLGTSGTLSTQSSALAITTGLPDQNSMSLSLTDLEPIAWGYDGIKSTATIRMADAANNPVPDGTTVTFTASGGSIEGSCPTLGGACSVIWTSQNPRPTSPVKVSFDDSSPFSMTCADKTEECRSGRVKILATAIGNESFIDGNGNGLYDNIESDVFVTSNGVYNSSTKNLPSSVDVTNEVVVAGKTSAQSTIYQLGGSAPQHYVSSVVLKSDSAGSIVFAPNIDYVLNAKDGTFEVISNTMTNQSIVASYNTKCSPATPNSAAAFGSSNGCDDLREAYVDKNFSGGRNANEEFIDFDQNGIFGALPNGKYDGALCAGDAKANGDCTTNKVTVRDEATLVMSCETPFIQPSTTRLPGLPDTVSLSAGGSVVSIPLLIADCNGNGMPKGTTIKAKTDSAKNVTATVSPSSGLGMTTEPTQVVLFITPDETKVPSGVITIDVASPSGLTTSFSISIL